MLANFIMRGYDAVGGSWIRWTAPGAPDFTGNYYTLTSPTFASLTNVHVLRREPSGSGATTLIALTDTPAGYGVNGQVLTTNGANAAVWADASGAFTWPSHDWRSQADVGVGTSTPIDLATHLPDLSTIDTGTALRKRTLVGDRAIIAPTEGTVFTDAAGVKLVEVAAGDYTVVVALDHYFDGVAFNSGYGSIDWAYGIVGFFGTDPSADSFYGAGVGRPNSTLNAAPLCTLEDSGLGGRNTFRVSLQQSYLADLNEGSSLAICRRGAFLYAYIGNGKAWTLVRGKSTGHTGAALIAVLTSCETAAATTETGITNWLKWDNGHVNAGLLPGWV